MNSLKTNVDTYDAYDVIHDDFFDECSETNINNNLCHIISYNYYSKSEITSNYKWNNGIELETVDSIKLTNKSDFNNNCDKIIDYYGKIYIADTYIKKIHKNYEDLHELFDQYVIVFINNKLMLYVHKNTPYVNVVLFKLVLSAKKIEKQLEKK